MTSDIESHHGEDPNDKNINEAAENQCNKFLVSFWEPVESHQVEKYPSNSATSWDDEQWKEHPQIETFLVCNYQKNQKASRDKGS